MTKRFHLAWPLLFAACMVFAEEPKPEPTTKAAESKVMPGDTSKKQAEVKKETPIALTIEAIQEIDARKAAQDQRERDLEERTRSLDTQEKLLKEKLKKIEELNHRMADKLDAFKKQFEDRVTKLVTVVEGMKPQSAAEYLENLDPQLAVEILARIQIPKASKILNLLDKKKSAKLTELYTGFHDSARDSKDDAKPITEKEGTKQPKPM